MKKINLSKENKEISELIEIGDQLLKTAVEDEEFEMATDINNILIALKKNDIRELEKEISKYKDEGINYKGYQIQTVQYGDFLSSIIFNENLFITFESTGESKEICIEKCKKYIDTIEVQTL